MTEGTQFQEVPQKQEASQEVQETAEARQALDRATLEPAAAIEKAVDIKTSETVEAAVKEAVEAVAADAATEDGSRETGEAAVPAADGGPETGDGEAAAVAATEDGGRETEKAAEAAADRRPETGDGEAAVPATIADGGSDVNTDEQQNQAQRLIQGQSDRARDLDAVGTSAEDGQRESTEERVQVEGAPRSDSEETPPPPEAGDSGVAPAPPPGSNAGEEDFTEMFSDEQQMVQDQIADQTTMVQGAAKGLETASEALDQVSEALDELTADQPEVDRSDDSAGDLREGTAEGLGQSNSTADRGSFSSNLTASQEIAAGLNSSRISDALKEIVGPVTGSVVIGEGSQQLEGSLDGLGDDLLAAFLKLNPSSPTGGSDELPLDGAQVQEAVEGDENTAELLRNYQETIQMLQSDLEKLQQLLENIQNAPEETQPPEVTNIHLPVKNSDGTYQLIEMPLPLTEGGIISTMANLQGQIIKITSEAAVLDN